MELTLVNESKTEVNAKMFTHVLDKLKDTEDEKVELLLTNNEAIQKLNKQFRDKDEPTDVLSFPMIDRERLWGQIVISVERAREQAEEIGQSLEDELQFLFAHGLLHLLGYDHQTPEDEEIMLEKTYKLIGRIARKK